MRENGFYWVCFTEYGETDTHKFVAEWDGDAKVWLAPGDAPHPDGEITVLSDKLIPPADAS